MSVSDDTGLSIDRARGKLGELIRQEGQVLRIMSELGYLGYAEISNKSGREILQEKLDHLRLQIAALREYVMIDSLDSLIKESKRLTELTVSLKWFTSILAGLAVVQILVTLFFALHR